MESDVEAMSDGLRRQSTLLEEIGRQATVFWRDDPVTDHEEDTFASDDSRWPQQAMPIRRVKSE